MERQKTREGMMANKGLNLAHPEFSEDFEAMRRELLAALPNEAAPPERLHIESLHRAANAAALAGNVIGPEDLT